MRPRGLGACFLDRVNFDNSLVCMPFSVLADAGLPLDTTWRPVYPSSIALLCASQRSFTHQLTIETPMVTHLLHFLVPLCKQGHVFPASELNLFSVHAICLFVKRKGGQPPQTPWFISDVSASTLNPHVSQIIVSVRSDVQS